MPSIFSKGLVEHPQNLIFLHKILKTYIHVELNKINEANEKIDIMVFKSKDGINLEYPVINEKVVDSMPTISGNVMTDSLAIIEHFKKNGYALVDTIESTNKGAKLS